MVSLVERQRKQQPQQQHNNNLASSSSSSVISISSIASTHHHIYLYAIIILLSLSLVVVLLSSNSVGQNSITTTTVVVSPITTTTATTPTLGPIEKKSFLQDQRNRNKKSSSSSLSFLTLQRAFACNPNDCFQFSHQQQQENPETLRIAFVGDSITYGNGTHDGDYLGKHKWEIGSWVSEVIQNLRNRGDQCEGSPFVNGGHHDRRQDNNNNNNNMKHFHFDARNFGIGKVSVTCQWNTIVKKPIFQRAVNFKPHVLVLGLGTNDCFHKCPEWSPEFFVQSLLQIVQKNFSSAKLVVMVTPPPMELTPFTLSLGFRPAMIQDPIVPLVRKVAKEILHVPLLDIFADWSKEFKGGTELENDWNVTKLIREGYMIGDGVHPSLRGHQDIARRFEKMICG